MLNYSLALNFQLAASGQLPSKLLLVPADRFNGRDGRSWINVKPAAVIAYNRALQRDIVIDIEHATHIKGPKGEAAPGQAWIKAESLEVIDGAIWGTVEWTEHGGRLVTNREYRYYSPAFLHDKAGNVIGIASVGLTNQHNLYKTPALNREEENVMELSAAIRAALKLKDDATEADALLAINTMKQDLSESQLALNRQQEAAPDISKFVPKETYELALNRAGEAEKKLADHHAKIKTTEAEALVDGGITARKIAPPNRDHFLAMCKQEGGLENVKAFIDTAPEIVAGELSPSMKTEEQLALNQEQREIAAMFGNTDEDLKKYGNL